jgi:glucosyl-3-phosphoglycerate synthase
MAELHQNGTVSTLHRLNTSNVETLEQELERFARRRPIALVLPWACSDTPERAMRQVVGALCHARYLDTVVVSLGQATLRHLELAKQLFAVLPQRVSIVWNDGPAVGEVYRQLSEHGLAAGDQGTARLCWTACGYVLADGRCEVIALHDAGETRTNGRERLARLCYPVVHPGLPFQFAKGCYGRVAGHLQGPVTRLLVTPLLRAVHSLTGPCPLLDYLGSFRYPLSREYAMRAEVARVSRLTSGWCLDVGLLSEVYRHCGPGRVCQTELGVTGRQAPPGELHAAGADGPLRAAAETAATLMRALAAEGLVIGDSFFKTLMVRYQRVAEDALDSYEADAAINSLTFHRHAEEALLSVFRRGLGEACARFASEPSPPAWLPGWERVRAAIPHLPELLRQAVEAESLAAAAA